MKINSNVKGIYRILDAAANRGREAIRVIEDICRFLRDNSPAVEALKSFRHEFGNLTKHFSWPLRLSERSTESDVGTTITGEGEYRRADLSEIFLANFCRLQESLRSIEEICKLELPELSPSFEQLRYRSYTLEKQLFPLLEDSQPTVLEVRRKKCANGQLYALIDTDFPNDQLQILLSGSVDLIQLRDKMASDQKILSTAKKWRELSNALYNDKSNSAPLLIMNDRPDLAVLAKFDGVHVGQNDLSPEDIRRIVGPDLLIGLSAKTIEQVKDAEAKDIDYIGAGPIFLSQTKTDNNLQGLDFLTQIGNNKDIILDDKQLADRKILFAGGGINEVNLESVLKTGINRIIVSSILTNSTNLKTLLDRINDFLTRYKK